MSIPKTGISNIVYLVVCLTGIAAFFLVGIYPNMQSMDELGAEAAVLSQKVQAQEVLYPIYRQLIKEVQQPIPSELVLPEPDALSQKDFNQINRLFYQLARQCDVDFISAVPDAKSYFEDAGHLTMHVSFKGDFFNFRKLLSDLCTKPYLVAIDQMRIETQATEKIISLKLRLLQN